jgi:hypothetical protein
LREEAAKRNKCKIAQQSNRQEGLKTSELAGVICQCQPSLQKCSARSASSIVGATGSDQFHP